MAQSGGTSASGRQGLEKSDVDEELRTTSSNAKPQSTHRSTHSRKAETTSEKQNARDEALGRELQTVRKINEALEGAIESLAKARSSMKVGP